MDEKRKEYFHIIRERYCKGCNICVAFCPRQVLVLKNGKVFPERPQLCIGCKACELRCPDFAIEVHLKTEEKAPERDSDAMDYSLPPEAMHA
ncbi:MAG: ferredoxin family protein [Rectinemataceae bacterium]